MIVLSVRMKSSAVSVSRFPALGRWDSAPSRPSGVPVLKKKKSAEAGVASDSQAIKQTAVRANFLIGLSEVYIQVSLALRAPVLSRGPAKVPLVYRLRMDEAKVSDRD